MTNTEPQESGNGDQNPASSDGNPAETDLFTSIARPIYIGIACALGGIAFYVLKELLFPDISARKIIIVVLWALVGLGAMMGLYAKWRGRRK